MGANFFSRQVGSVWKNCFASTVLNETLSAGWKNAADK
jgi:hypothetical protein